MNDSHGASTGESNPAYWYGLPHGYHQLDLQPSLGGLEKVARQISHFPDGERDRADQMFRMYAAMVMMLQKQRVQGCGLGIHTDDTGQTSLSVLVAASVTTEGVNPKVALTRMMADGGAVLDRGMRPVEIPVGTGFLMESVRKVPAPGLSADGEEGARQERIWQGLIAIPDVRSSSVITLQMVTPSVDLAGDYRGVLLGVARTVTFTDPSLEQGADNPGRASLDADGVRNVFG